MIYSDIMKMPQLKELVLVGGKNGLYRPIRWIYFADCMECLDEQSENLADWIHGGELIIVTHQSITKNIKKFKQLMYAADQRNAAGVIVHVGRIAPEILAVANELSLPLFELPLSIKLVDLSQSICKKLIEEENKQNILNKLFIDLLHRRTDDMRELLYQAQNYGIYFSKSFCIVNIAIVFDFDNQIENSKADTDKANLNKLLQYEFYNAGIQNLLKTDNADGVTVMVPLYKIEKTCITKILTVIKKHFKQFYNSDIYIGVSKSYNTANALRAAYDEATAALNMVDVINDDTGIVFYEKIGIYSILMEVKNDKLLQNYYRKYLSPLIEYDKQQKQNLCDTLEKYLQCNGKISETAQGLFVHRNTLRARLDKIETIFNKSLTDFSFCFDLQIAFCIKRYLEKSRYTT